MVWPEVEDLVVDRVEPDRMLGQLHHCLLTRIPFDEAVAFPLGAVPLPTQAVPDV
ncbi:hypothetical protein OG625_38260 [Streptomyces sp. NBC_01351]|uniref:hypothetical protein n=1 Tax=Streptomyces sp. NBC_01351 TaxID=2903833 RepID=UPI002E303B29|nr:hypothetical protein [Streptomyces sp. NBC_01351]